MRTMGKVKSQLVFRSGVDLTTTNPCLMDIQSCMAARYDAGICRHAREHTGVIEIYKVGEKEMEEVKVIGCMDHTLDNTFESANRVYDADGLCPALPTCCGGGGHQPKVIECECLGGFGEKKSNNGSQYYQQDRVYSMGDVAMCLPSQLPGGSYNYIEEKKIVGVVGSTQKNAYVGNGDVCPSLTEAMGMGGGQTPMVCEKTIVAMRGRNPDNPSDRTAGIELEQRLEPNAEGICNTLTCVQKDNLVLEKKSIKIRQATKDGFIDCEVGGCWIWIIQRPRHAEVV